MRALHILVVDDSVLFRDAVAREIIPYLPLGSSVDKARNAFEARDKILEIQPDMMLLSVELPNMDGIEFLRRLLPQYKQKTIVLGGNSKDKEAAIAAGAVDFIHKDGGNIVCMESHFYKELADSICKALDIKRENFWHTSSARGTAEAINLIAIGASTGGTEALAEVMKNLRPPMPGIVVVQHIPPMFSRLFAQRLDSEGSLDVKEAESGDAVLPNHAFVAPGNYQLRVKRCGGRYLLECSEGARVNGHAPSVDVLFDSVALSAGASALGVILTGMGADGAKGLLAMRQAGARTLGQDEASSVVYGMPRAAWQMGAVERQLSLEAIAGVITALVRK